MLPFISFLVMSICDFLSDPTSAPTKVHRHSFPTVYTALFSHVPLSLHCYPLV